LGRGDGRRISILRNFERGDAPNFANLIARSRFVVASTMVKTPEIIAFRPATIPEPPPDLSSSGSRLWRTVMARYVIGETHAELLRLACQAADRGESLREQINREGATVTGSQGQPVAHPLIAAEGAAQKRVAQFLKQLGLFDEPKREKPGRPPKSGGF
jgi:P27 family predicted phage terminase small subunit